MNRKQAPNRTEEVDTKSQMMVPEQRMPHLSDFFLTPSKINLLEKNAYAQNRVSNIFKTNSYEYICASTEMFQKPYLLHKSLFSLHIDSPF
jgi:hypothetical protein